MKTLIQAIEESCTKQGKSKSQVTKLVLDSTCKASDLQTSLSGLTNLEYLSLCNTNLVSLVGLPALPKLKVLKLSDNRIPGSHLVHISALSNLTHLDLAGNAGITKLEHLQQPLTSLSHLKRLDLDGCPVKENTADFNQKIFHMINELEYLDNVDRKGAERDADDDEEEDDDEDYEGEGDDGGAEGEEEVRHPPLPPLRPYFVHRTLKAEV